MKRRSVLLQIGIVSVLVAVIIISATFNSIDASKNTTVPEYVSNMKLDNYTNGTQALAQMNQLHFTDIDMISAYIAEYSNKSNPYSEEKTGMIVWAGVSRSYDDASELLNRMVDRIDSSTTSAFESTKKLTFAGTEVYQVSGPGGDHYFYHSQKSPDTVIWLIIQNIGDTIALVEQALNLF